MTFENLSILDLALSEVKRVKRLYFTVVLFVFQFYPSCDFRKFINFGLGTVRSEKG